MIRIESIAAYLPGAPIPSEAIEQKLGWKPGWIEKNSGVETRYHVGPLDTTVSMAVNALQSVLDQSGVKPEDIDLLICASGTFDQPIPHNSCLIKQQIGWEHLRMPCFDVDSTCLSYLNALEVAAALIETGRYQRIAIVNSEVGSLSMNPEDKKTQSLFGDAAVASLVVKGSQARPTPTYFINFAEGARYAQVPAGGVAMRRTHGQNPLEAYHFQMDGRRLLKLTFKHVDDFIHNVQTRFSRCITDYSQIVIHQASKLGSEIFAKRFKLGDDILHRNLPKYGNCISSSIPLGLWDVVREGKVQAGDEVLLMGTAAGLSMGGVVVEV